MKNEFAAKIVELRIEHFDLDAAIVALSNTTPVDQLQVKRLKKRKLAIKDMITRMESKMIPDIDA